MTVAELRPKYLVQLGNELYSRGYTTHLTDNDRRAVEELDPRLAHKCKCGGAVFAVGFHNSTSYRVFAICERCLLVVDEL